MKNIIQNITTLCCVMLLASCAQDQEPLEKSIQATAADWDSDGVAFAEFLMCTKGPDFSRANLEEMSEAFGQLALSEDLIWSGGYAPVSYTHLTLPTKA